MAPPTYLLAALKRYVSSQLYPAGSALRNPDGAVGQLLPPGMRVAGSVLAAALRQSDWACNMFFHALPQARTASMTVRTRFFDDSVRAAVDDGARQLVILAAGLDTRAYRLSSELRNVRVFEVDLPASHAYKRERLRCVGLLNDWRVVFVPADLSSLVWISALREAGCDLDSTRTHVLWEGCTYYLNEAAVKQTLRLLHYPNVTISFDCGDKIIVNDVPSAAAIASGFSSFVTRLGEPFRFGVEFNRLSEWLREQDWELLDEVHETSEMQRRFLPGATEYDQPFNFFALSTIRPIEMQQA